MVLGHVVGGSDYRKAEPLTLGAWRAMGPPPPPPIPPTLGMYYFPESPPFPPPGAVVRAPIIIQLNPAAVKHMDVVRSRSLVKFIGRSGVVPSVEEERRRERVVGELDKIVMDWARWVACIQRKPPLITTGTLLTYGSYALGAYGPESDIDAVCVGPCIASLEHDFFVILRQMLEERPEVSDLHSIETARVPLMRFKFNGVSVDFPYVQLPVINAAEAMRAFDPRLLEKVDRASWRSLSGVRVNRQIMQLVPNMKKFQVLLRCLKLWARKRGIHCHLLGFFAGIHLTLLAAYVCCRYPNCSANTLFSLFFDIFYHWPWPLPLSLNDQLPLWTPDMWSPMPIVMPCIPPEICASTMTKSTFNKIMLELRRGFILTKDIRNLDIEWTSIFAPFPYAAKYEHFLCIVLSAPTTEELRDWVGWVKSRFRNLILKLESLDIGCDPDPSEHVDHTIAKPNVVFLWGLMYRRSMHVCANSLKKDFMKIVINNIYGKEKCLHSDITMSIVGTSQLPKGVYDPPSLLAETSDPPPLVMGYQPVKQHHNVVR